MKRSIWIHAGAYGEFVNLLPLLDALHERYPDLGFVLSSNFPDLLRCNLQAFRSYLPPSPLYLPMLNAFKLRKMFRNPPVLWISYSQVIEVALLRMCSLHQVPVIYIYEGFFCTSMRSFPLEDLEPFWSTTTGIAMSARKSSELNLLGLPIDQIQPLRSLKWLR